MRSAPPTQSYHGKVRLLHDVGPPVRADIKGALGRGPQTLDAVTRFAALTASEASIKARSHQAHIASLSPRPLVPGLKRREVQWVRPELVVSVRHLRGPG